MKLRELSVDAKFSFVLIDKVNGRVFAASTALSSPLALGHATDGAFQQSKRAARSHGFRVETRPRFPRHVATLARSRSRIPAHEPPTDPAHVHPTRLAGTLLVTCTRSGARAATSWPPRWARDSPKGGAGAGAAAATRATTTTTTTTTTNNNHHHHQPGVHQFGQSPVTPLHPPSSRASSQRSVSPDRGRAGDRSRSRSPSSLSESSAGASSASAADWATYQSLVTTNLAHLPAGRFVYGRRYLQPFEFSAFWHSAETNRAGARAARCEEPGDGDSRGGQTSWSSSSSVATGDASFGTAARRRRNSGGGGGFVLGRRRRPGGAGEWRRRRTGAGPVRRRRRRPGLRARVVGPRRCPCPARNPANRTAPPGRGLTKKRARRKNTRGCPGVGGRTSDASTRRSRPSPSRRGRRRRRAREDEPRIPETEPRIPSAGADV